MNGRLSWFNATSLALGFSFLYLPLLVMIVYSFNASEMVTVWAGFSTKWYVALYNNQAYWNAAGVTIRVAFAASIIAVVLGTMAAFVNVRYRRFKGRSLFMGMVYAPLIMPEVISALALLLLFIAAGIERGMITVIIAHATFSICFVTIIVSSRLATIDVSLEEAALDLGASPLGAFMRVTLPIIAPAVISGWFLSLALSLDNLVTSAFTTGPSASTLPMLVYSQVRLGLSPQINALSSIIIAVVLMGTIIAALSNKRRTVKREAEIRKSEATG